MVLGGLVLGSLIVYLKGMRIMMFQLSGYYCTVFGRAEHVHPKARDSAPKRRTKWMYQDPPMAL